MDYLGYFLPLITLFIGYWLAWRQFKFESIHKRRLYVIEEAYSKLKLASMAFRSLTAPLQEAVDLNEEEKRKEKDLVEKVNDMLIYLDTKKIFFSSEEQENIKTITDKFFQTWNNYRFKKDIKGDPSFIKEQTRLYQEIWNSVDKEIPELISSLEKIFKKALGLR